MTVTIPDDRIGDVRVSEHDALVDIAIGLYKREEVSLGRAAEIANMPSPAFLHELGRRKIRSIMGWKTCDRTSLRFAKSAERLLRGLKPCRYDGRQ
jgi:predicted HTH domain antitoxin